MIDRDNVRFPKGDDGIKTLMNMNEVHNSGALMAIDKINFTPKNIIEIGCGGGQNIINLKNKFPSSNILALDYSPTSINLSREITKNLSDITFVLDDICNVNLGFKFDLATAFETIYFWNDINKAFKNIYNFLNTNGQFLIYIEGSTHKTLKDWSVGVELKNQLEPSQISEILTLCGFSDVKIYNLIGEKVAIISIK